MIEPALGESEGLPALRRFADEVGGWPESIPDWQWCARFNYQVIERRGTGGGNFRLMYSRFLEEVGAPRLPCGRAAERWSELAAAMLQQGSEEDAPEPTTWASIAAGLLECEEALWPSLMS